LSDNKEDKIQIFLDNPPNAENLENYSQFYYLDVGKKVIGSEFLLAINVADLSVPLSRNYGPSIKKFLEKQIKILCGLKNIDLVRISLFLGHN
jgi:hypothetical protein